MAAACGTYGCSLWHLWLQARDPQRAKLMVAQLPLAKRLRLALRLETRHTELLEQACTRRAHIACTRRAHIACTWRARGVHVACAWRACGVRVACMWRARSVHTAHHAEPLEQLRTIYRDEPPKWERKGDHRAASVVIPRLAVAGAPCAPARAPRVRTAPTSACPHAVAEVDAERVSRRNSTDLDSFEPPHTARGREKHRRETEVNAVLAAANATRVSLGTANEVDPAPPCPRAIGRGKGRSGGDPLPASSRAAAQGNKLTRQLADSQVAAYNPPGLGSSAQWWKEYKYQSGIWKALHMDKPSTPRRV